MTAPAAEKTPATTTAKSGPDKRIPAVLTKNSILGEFCVKYLGVVDEILAYNKEVLADRDSEWNAGKVMERARTYARPVDTNETPDAEILAIYEAYEKALDAFNLARKSVLDATAKKLGITLSATAQRNPEAEAPLKEKRKLANEIAGQLVNIAKMTSNDDAEGAINKFIEENPLPAVGRDQVKSFGNDGASTPKYRVSVKVYNKDGNEILSEDGFTKSALKLTQAVFGYERGKAPKSEDLRKAWEAAGNTPQETKVSPVEFDDNNLHYVITKK